MKVLKGVRKLSLNKQDLRGKIIKSKGANGHGRKGKNITRKTKRTNRTNRDNRANRTKKIRRTNRTKKTRRTNRTNVSRRTNRTERTKRTNRTKRTKRSKRTKRTRKQSKKIINQMRGGAFFVDREHSAKINQMEDGDIVRKWREREVRERVCVEVFIQTNFDGWIRERTRNGSEDERGRRRRLLIGSSKQHPSMF